MAPPGDLDTSFDGNGKKTINFGGTDSAHAVLVQPNGRIVVAGGGAAANSFCVARLRPNGSFDPGFGSAGKRTIDFGGGGRVTLPGNGIARAVLVQPDRQIVVAGNASRSAMMTVTRLNPNGSPDTTFDGDGTATIDFGVTADVAGGAAAGRQDRRRRLHPGRRGRGGGAPQRKALRTPRSASPGRRRSTSASPHSASRSRSSPTAGSSWPARGRPATTSRLRAFWADSGAHAD